MCMEKVINLLLPGGEIAREMGQKPSVILHLHSVVSWVSGNGKSSCRAGGTFVSVDRKYSTSGK